MHSTLIKRRKAIVGVGVAGDKLYCVLRQGREGKEEDDGAGSSWIHYTLFALECSQAPLFLTPFLSLKERGCFSHSPTLSRG